MKDRLHEIIAHVAVIHNSLIQSNKITKAKEVFEFIKDY